MSGGFCYTIPPMKFEGRHDHRPSDHEGIPYCHFHDTVWASHKALVDGVTLYLCAHCDRRPWPKSVKRKKLIPLAEFNQAELARQKKK